MSSCFDYDFQKWTVLSLGLTAATLIVGLVLMQVGHGQINNNNTSSSETEKPMEVNWTMISSLAAVGGIMISAVTFWKTYSRMKKSEQVRMAHEIENSLASVMDNIIKAMDAASESQRSTEEKNNAIKVRYMQYIDVWEWYSFLVNKNQINMKDIIDHFRPPMLNDYHTFFQMYPEFEKEGRFKEFRALCERLESEK